MDVLSPQRWPPRVVAVVALSLLVLAAAAADVVVVVVPLLDNGDFGEVGDVAFADDDDDDDAFIKLTLAFDLYVTVLVALELLESPVFQRFARRSLAVVGCCCCGVLVGSEARPTLDGVLSR